MVQSGSARFVNEDQVLKDIEDDNFVFPPPPPSNDELSKSRTKTYSRCDHRYARRFVKQSIILSVTELCIGFTMIPVTVIAGN